VDNADVAAVFQEMGDLLAIVGGDQHRARAFRTTARLIEGLRQPLKDMLLLNQLKDVRGLGPGSIERIRQILQTGTCPDHQRLLARLPRGLRELLQLRGFGPRHARLAHEHLGVQNLEQLEVAARSGLLARVPGIGPLTVERVLRDLEARKEAPPTRLSLRVALEVGAALVAWMLEHPGTIKAAQTGSARRRKESVGDLDVLCASTSPLLASAHFVSHPDVRDVLLQGDARASVLLASGVQADLRLVAAENWGAGLHYFTGSKPHNIAMRIRANAHQLALSEMGIWERKLKGRGRGEENRRIARRISACTDEAEVFSNLGLPFIAPELREGEGELDAALTGRLPALIDEVHLRGEPHLAARTLDDARAILTGQRRAHGDGADRWALWLRPLEDVATPAARAKHRADAARASRATGTDVVAGALVAVDAHGALVGAVDEVDVIVADLGRGPHVPKQTKAEATARALAVIDSGVVRGIARLQDRAPPADVNGIDLDVRAVLAACARRHVFVEVRGAELSATTCRIATEVGALLAITGRPGDDGVVDDDELAQRWRFGLWQARRGWCTPAQTINALTPPALRALLRLGPPRTAADAGEDAPAGDDVDPLFQLERRSELMTRLAAFLQGEGDDPVLRRALERRGGNALAEAFALLAAGGD